MKAKNLLRISLFAVVFCALLVLTTLAATDAKIISFDGTQLHFEPSKAASNIVGSDLGMLVNRVDMDAEECVKKTYEPKYTLTSVANQFKLSEYPYVKIKMRNTWDKTIQFYIPAEGGGYYLSYINEYSGIKDGTWKEIELYYPNDGRTASSCNTDGTNTFRTTQLLGGSKWPNLTEGDSYYNPTVKEIFFQFKDRNEAAENDMFAEIEYVAFFKTFEEMHAYKGLDAKVIRFDGANTVPYTVTGSSLYTMDESDGVLKVTGSKYNNNFFVNATAPVDITEYPYMTMEFKTNDSDAFMTDIGSSQFYLLTTDNENGTGSGYTSWKDAERSKVANYFANQDRKQVFYLGTDATAKAATPNGGFNGTNKRYFTAMRFEPAKKYDTDTNFYADAVMEVKYIAFFKTLEEAVNYAHPSKVVMSGKESIDHRASLAAVPTFDGSYRIEANKDFFPYFSGINLAKNYLLADYPYIKMKLKTNWKDTIQFYFNTCSKDRLNAYLYRGVNPEDDVDTIYTMNANTMAPTGVISGTTAMYPKDTTNKVTLGADMIFLQFKSMAKEDNYYAEIPYIAFFSTEAERDAFGAAETAAVNAAQAALNGSTLDVAVHPAAPFETLNDIIADTIEARYSGVYAEVVEIDDIEEGTKSAEVAVVLDNPYADSEKYAVINVNITYLSDITIENLGATIRVDAVDTEKYTTSAMRFGTSLTYDAEDYPNAVFGAAMSNAADPVLYSNNKVRYHQAAKHAVEEGATLFNTVITSIPKTQLNTKVYVRPYITYSVNGVKYTYYGDTIARSVNDIVNAIGE